MERSELIKKVREAQKGNIAALVVLLCLIYISQKYYKPWTRTVPSEMPCFKMMIPLPGSTFEKETLKLLERNVYRVKNMRESTAGEAIASQLSKDESYAGSGFEGYFECDTMPQLVEYPPPKYPELMEKAGIQGMTIHRLLVDEGGRVKEVHVMESSGHRPLDEAAMQAATKTIFRPGKVGGKAVPYHFELKDKENKK